MVACWSGLPTRCSAETTGVLRKSGPKSGRPWAMRRSWMLLQLLRLSMRSTGSPIRREYRSKTQTQNQRPNCAMRWGSMRLRSNEVKSPILETVPTRPGAFDRRRNIRALAGPFAVRACWDGVFWHRCPAEGWMAILAGALFGHSWRALNSGRARGGSARSCSSPKTIRNRRFGSERSCRDSHNRAEAEARAMSTAIAGR